MCEKLQKKYFRRHTTKYVPDFRVGIFFTKIQKAPSIKDKFHIIKIKNFFSPQATICKEKKPQLHPTSYVGYIAATHHIH